MTGIHSQLDLIECLSLALLDFSVLNRPIAFGHMPVTWSPIPNNRSGAGRERGWSFEVASVKE